MGSLYGRCPSVLGLTSVYRAMTGFVPYPREFGSMGKLLNSMESCLPLVVSGVRLYISTKGSLRCCRLNDLRGMSGGVIGS